jgi:hypothetical protein
VLDRLVVVARTFLASDSVEARACAVTAGVGATEARGTAATLQRRRRIGARSHQFVDSSTLLRFGDR